jgi:putative membrane protein
MLRKMMWVGAVTLLATAAGTRADDKKAAPFDDATFVRTAAIAGMFEVHLGKLAAERTKNDDVKKFAEMMVKDHTAANEELKAAAKAAGIAVPDKIDDAHQQKYEAFKAYKGKDFDGDYMKQMVKDHTDAVALFTQASKEAKHKELRDFATKTLPVIQGHLDKAKKLSK